MYPLHRAVLNFHKYGPFFKLCVHSNSSILVIHIGQSLFYRTWFMLPTAGFGGVLEIVGWAARLWSNKNVDLSTPFTIQ